jgi:hypothetical protein
VVRILRVGGSRTDGVRGSRYFSRLCVGSLRESVYFGLGYKPASTSIRRVIDFYTPKELHGSHLACTRCLEMHASATAGSFFVPRRPRLNPTERPFWLGMRIPRLLHIRAGRIETSCGFGNSAWRVAFSAGIHATTLPFLPFPSLPG